MQIQLNDDEVQTLRSVINAYLPTLRREAAATELPSRELRQDLHKRLALCERLVGDLDRSAAAPPR